MKAVNETGNRYGRLLVAEREGSDSRGAATWRATCDCGNQIIVPGKSLRNGTTESCGCLRLDLLTKNENGNSYGRLKVLCRGKDRIGSSGRKKITWVAQCDCGLTVEVDGASLRNGDVRSCGCLHSEIASKNGKSVTTHGHTSGGQPSPTYLSWCSMIQRCTNPNATGYDRYGAAGVKVHKKWKRFNGFLEDMGERPEGKTLGRIGDKGNYEPGNCEWQTDEEQGATRRKSKWVKLESKREE